MYRDKANVEHEMYDYTGNNWSHRNSYKIFKEESGTIPGKHSIDSLQKPAVLGTSHVLWKYCSLKLEVWAEGITVGKGEVPGGKKPVARENNNIIIILIIIIIN